MGRQLRRVVSREAGARLVLTFAVFAALILTWWPVTGLGHPMGEADNHLWMIAWALAGDDHWFNLPVGGTTQLMDPINLLWWAPAWPWGPDAAWTAGILGNLALAGGGGGFLGWVVTGDEDGAAVAAVATSCSAFLVGAVDFAITEAWTVGWIALHLAFIVRFRRSGSGVDLAAAGVALAGWVASGWYACAFAGILELCLIAAPGRRGWVAAQAAFAGATEVPRLLDFARLAPLWSGRYHAHSAGLDNANWRTDPRLGTDLLNLFAPPGTVEGPSHAVYVGLGAVALAACAGRRSLPFLGLAAAFWVLALGHWLRIGGHALAPLPAGWLAAHTPLAGISHWYRAAGPATPVLAAAAALGATRLLNRWFAAGNPRRALVAAAIVLAVAADGALLGGTAWPRTQYRPALPAELSAIDGPLLELPLLGVKPLPGFTSARPYAQWQAFTLQPVAENYEWPDDILRANPLVARWQAVCALPASGAPDERSPGGGGLASMPREQAGEGGATGSLREEGFAWVVVHPKFARGGCVEAVSAVLGAATFSGENAVGWRLR